MHARYYTFNLGRFMSVDPFNPISLQFGDEDDRAAFQRFLTRSGAWNRYTYALNNPIRYRDSNGRSPGAGALALPWFFGGGETAAASSIAAAPAAPVVVVVGVGLAAGYGMGTLVNAIPTGDGKNVGDRISEVLVNTFFSGAANDARSFIAKKVGTVFQHIGRYAPPDPNDPDDKSRKKNIGERMKKHLEAARKRLKRLKGKSRKEYEEMIQRAEEALED